MIGKKNANHLLVTSRTVTQLVTVRTVHVVVSCTLFDTTVNLGKLTESEEKAKRSAWSILK